MEKESNCRFLQKQKWQKRTQRENKIYQSLIYKHIGQTVKSQMKKKIIPMNCKLFLTFGIGMKQQPTRSP